MVIMESSTLGKLYFDTTTICAPQHIQALLFVGTIVVFGIIFVCSVCSARRLISADAHVDETTTTRPSRSLQHGSCARNSFRSRRIVENSSFDSQDAIEHVDILPKRLDTFIRVHVKLYVLVVVCELCECRNCAVASLDSHRDAHLH